jgi:dipeptidyl aminopeptidase/acylaminoacyl peptidase
VYPLLRTVLPVALAALPWWPLVAQQGVPPAPSDTGALAAIIASERYVAPPEAIARLVTAPREANVSFTTPSPVTRRWFLRTVGDGLPTLERLGKAHLNLGGLQLDHAANRERGLTTRSGAGLELVEWESGRRITVQVPAGARVGPTAWSPDGERLAFLALFPDATHLYVADAATGRSRRLSPRSLLATLVTQPQWTADGRSIVTVLVPAGRGPEPREPALAPGPMVRVNENNKLKTRTYMDLLLTPYEQELLEYHVTGQLAVIDAQSGATRPVGAPGMIRALDPSPDGRHLRATYVEKPFSYVLPVSAFGTREVILDAAGREVTELAKRPLREGESTDPVDPTDPPRPAAAPGGAARAAADTGRRNLAWHPFQPGLLYAQLARPATGAAAARTDSASLARRPDRLVHWTPPFDSASAVTLYETPNRITAARFSDDGRILFVTESGAGGTFEQAIFLDENNAKFTVIAPRARGAGGDSAARAPATPPGPGAGGRGGGAAGGLVTRMGRRGVPVVMVSTDGKSVFTQGTTPDSAGRPPRAYVERVEIRTGARTRIYESSGDLLETISAPLDDDFTRAIVQREGPTTVPQSFVLTLATGEARQLTQNRDPMPEITNAVRRTVTARRADGYSFRVKVTLPAGYKEGTRLPAMFWFYPREYDTQEAYDRSLSAGAAGPGSAHRFTTYGPRSLAFLVTQGYAVVEPDAPIFASDGQLPNDNYVVDLRNNLAATIDALDTLAIIDRQRLGIGGHSYGAFSTVNAMVHTPFFKAGIAGDGAYNRTLTPNGFQSERRDLWQGRQTYLEMSPILYADQLNGALLLYHSTEDQNVGTDPINSIKLFHVLQGLGKNVSLYLYPYEDHGPIARETVLDQWARWVAWLDKYVKNAGKKPEAKVTTMQ